MGRLDQTLGDLPAATAAYSEALAIYQDLREVHRRGEALIGLGECALEVADAPAARAYFAELNALLSAPGQEQDALHRPPGLYWRAAEVARQIAPEHAAALQHMARRLLDLRTAVIGDSDLTRSFLHIPEHQAIRAA